MEPELYTHEEREEYLAAHPGPWMVGRHGHTKTELVDGAGMHLGTFVGQYGDKSGIAISMMCAATAMSGMFAATAPEAFLDLLERILLMCYTSAGREWDSDEARVLHGEEEIAAIKSVVIGNRPIFDRDSRRRLVRAVIERCMAIYTEYDAAHPG